ncbi:aromatic ring-hydroxylating dioxygenase subunit alpha [Pseudonocardia yuanmonensis]|uniref:Aromatic ring-hydroxylating dioxygenase subunit alpha n=1 Tax=Pseudonocardia yuanmonensis TaxID=1095914 RepID=A0ABP8XMY9_9PSEU
MTIQDTVPTTGPTTGEERRPHAPRNDRIRRALDHIRNDSTDEFDGVNGFTAEEFTDPGIARRERDAVFGRVPSIVCHGSEIPKPNDFLTLQMPRNNIIVVRQKDGSVRSFVNLCRHRGALLEEQEKGRCRLFSCGYHRWSYDTDGSLRAITRDNTFGEIDRSKFGLIELPTEERHGFVWVVDDADAEIDVASWLGPDMDEILAGYGMDSLVSARAEGFDEPVNWKIMQDAFLDGYHIQYAHPNTAAKHIHTNVMAVEDFGRHARFIAPRKTIDKFLEEPPAPDEDLSKYVTETHFLLPNSTLLRQPDHFELLTFRPHPTDPGRCRMEMRLVVPTVEDSGMDSERWNRIWDKNWKILLAVLHQEDFPLLRSSQAGMTSANAGGMVLGRNEYVNQIFHRELKKLTS